MIYLLFYHIYIHHVKKNFQLFYFLSFYCISNTNIFFTFCFFDNILQYYTYLLLTLSYLILFYFLRRININIAIAITPNATNTITGMVPVFGE